MAANYIEQGRNFEGGFWLDVIDITSTCDYSALRAVALDLAYVQPQAGDDKRN